MIDIQPTTEDSDVKAVEDSLSNTRREIDELESRLEDLEITLPKKREEVADVRASVEVGDATESDLRTAEEELNELESEAEYLSERLDTLRRVESRLQTKRLEAIEEAAQSRQRAANDAAESAMSALLSALSDAEEARRRLDEVREFARQTRNHTDVPAQCLGGSKSSGVGVFGHSRDLEHTLSQLQKTYGDDE